LIERFLGRTATVEKRQMLLISNEQCRFSCEFLTAKSLKRNMTSLLTRRPITLPLKQLNSPNKGN